MPPVFVKNWQVKINQSRAILIPVEIFSFSARKISKNHQTSTCFHIVNIDV